MTPKAYGPQALKPKRLPLQTWNVQDALSSDRCKACLMWFLVFLSIHVNSKPLTNLGASKMRLGFWGIIIQQNYFGRMLVAITPTSVFRWPLKVRLD